MNTALRVRYGAGWLPVEPPPGVDTWAVTASMPPPLPDPSAALGEALNAPLGTPPLLELARGKRTACILVCDGTRPVPNQLVLPPVLHTLERAGVLRDGITLLIALGTHRAMTDAELEHLLGADLLRTYTVVQHDCRATSELRRLGETQHGTPIISNTQYLDADLKLVTGLVEPHFMAGYSGGRKVVAIGLAGLDMLPHLHGPGLLEHPGARAGVLADNPLHAELVEIADTVGGDFCVNVVIDDARRPVGLTAGALHESHAAACAIVDAACRATVPVVADVVVTSAAGEPLDRTYYQAVKGLVNVLDIVRPGGAIVLAAACQDGLGSAYFRQELQRLAEATSPEAYVRSLEEPGRFTPDQWEVEELTRALRRASVFVVADGLDAEEAQLTGATPAPSMAAAVDAALAATGGTRVAVVPEGPYVLPAVAA